jgi:glutamine synthetase
MFANYDAVIRFIKRKRVAEVDLKYVDLEGKIHHLSIPSNSVTTKRLEEGEGIDASSVTGLGSVENADAVIIPDLKTGFIELVNGTHTVSFFCDVCDCHTHQPLRSCSRGVVKRAQKYLQGTKIAANLMVSPEFEFHLFDRISLDIRGLSSSFSVLSPESIEGRKSSGSWVEKDGGYHVDQPNDILYPVRKEISSVLERAGVKVKYHHHEAGGPSQVEIEVYFKPLVETSDDIVKSKYLIRRCSEEMGKVAVFLPKPLNGMAGNGMHVHFFLERDKRSMFYSKGGFENLSKKALYFIGGIIKHGRAITGIACPSTNSFRRLIPGFEAPITLSYSVANRSAAIRIPLYVRDRNKKRVEFRISDATTNPYLFLSALLLAGIDGIKGKIDPGRPTDINLFEKRAQHLTPIPETLDEALRYLDKDRKFLLQGGVFDEGIIDEWIKVKREGIQRMRKSVHPVEYELYLNI